MKKVLFIAYDFPPARTGGVYRPVKFAKYLPEFGWMPTILTVKNYPKEALDESLLKDLPPQISIYRAYSFEIERFENWIFSKLYKKATPPAQELQDTPSNNIVTKGPRQSLFKRLVFSPLYQFIEKYIHSPDTKIGWIPLAIWTGLKAIHREKIDIIFSTSPPETNHIVALWLSRLTGRPLVTDFRDPWTTHYTRQDMHVFRARHEKKLEQNILMRAKAIIHTGEGRAQLVKEAFSQIPIEKHHIITNGYDEADFANLALGGFQDIYPIEYLNLVSVGFIYPDTALESLLQGFSQALNSAGNINKLRLIFVGEQSPYFAKILSNSPVIEHVIKLGFKPHKEAIQLMAHADVLLLLLPKGDERMSNKIIAGRTFEFIRTGKPILMIGWYGESATIIEKSCLGKFVSFDDIDQIEKSLTDYYYKKMNGQLSIKPNWDYIRQFERRQLTQKLAKLLDASSKKE